MLKSSQTDHGALILMAITVTLWGFSWIVMKHLATLIGPFDLVMLRYGVAFVIVFIMLLASRQRLTFPPFWLTLGIAVFQTTAFQCLSQLALLQGGAGHVVMLAYTMPFWVVLFAWAFLGERPGRQQMVALALAAVGLVAVIAPWRGLGSLTGSLLALAGGMGWGVGTLLAKRLFQRHTPNVLSVTAWQMLLGAMLTWPFTLVFPQPDVVWTAEVIWGLAYMSILASALGWWLWLSVVRRVSATVAGMSSLGVPVLTVILAWALLGERPTLLEIAGIVFIMAGLVVVTTASAQSARSRPR
ncbi:MAG TPA: DMT family transporter [Burkholderiaceae bacterium]|nr:DMT family transporter [Burkholderiaceae bacterium]